MIMQKDEELADLVQPIDRKKQPKKFLCKMVKVLTFTIFYSIIET